MTTATQTDIKLVAHLMRRAAFGLPAHRLELLAEQSYEDLVEDLIDACLYELGCVEIGSNTKAILLEESDLPATIQIDDHFGDRGHQIIELIVASREYQLS